jgi:hypothetical protein
VKTPLYVDASETHMMMMIYPFSVGTLTFVKIIEIFVESLGHCTRTIRSTGLFFFLLVKTIRTSCIFKLSNQ